MEPVIPVVVLVVVILNLILFFKVWAMTNNIKQMTKDTTDILTFLKVWWATAEDKSKGNE